MKVLYDFQFQAFEVVRSMVDNLELCPIAPGQYLICTDSGDLFYDTKDGVRKHLTDIIDIETDAERIAILAPLDKTYFVKGTGHFWRYLNGAWVDLSTIAAGGSGGNSTVLSASKPVGQKANDEWLEVLAVE